MNLLTKHDITQCCEGVIHSVCKEVDRRKNKTRCFSFVPRLQFLMLYLTLEGVATHNLRPLIKGHGFFYFF